MDPSNSIVLLLLRRGPEHGSVFQTGCAAVVVPPSNIIIDVSYIELGPPLGLHLNIKKCEVFSSGCLAHFPIEMKQSSKPNLEILGIPIGDADFCRAVLDRKRSEAGFLLKRLGKSTPKWLLYSSSFVVVTVSLSILLVLYLLLSLYLFCRYLIKMCINVSHLVQVCILPMLHGNRPS